MIELFFESFAYLASIAFALACVACGLAMVGVAIIMVLMVLWWVFIESGLIELIAYAIYYLLKIMYLTAKFLLNTLAFAYKECKSFQTESKQNILLAILAIGCLATSIGFGVNSTGSGTIYKLFLVLIAISMLATRIYENCEFRNSDHDMSLYQTMKRQDGTIGLGIGAICFVVAVLVTGSMAISLYTIPGLAVFLLSSGKIAKYTFIDLASVKALSLAIKVKYFFIDTSKLIAKAINFKMSQKTQQVAA